jgi:ADP-heptose:LPS heptosyltransferase
MFELSRLKMGLWYTRFHFRKQQDPVVRFTEAVGRARKALVILPESMTDMESLQSVMKYLNRRFGAGSVMVLAREEFATSVRANFSAKTITYHPKEISRWYIPTDGLLRKMKSSTFDIALDLNVTLALPSAFMCRESNAPLRVGFAKPNADQFYNFQVQTRMTTNTPVAFKNLLKCLDMF